MFANWRICKAFIHLLVYFTCGSTFHLIFAPRANVSVSDNRRSGIFKRSSLGPFHQWQYTCMPCRPTCRCFVCVVHTPGTHTLNHKHFPYSTDPCTHKAFTHTPPHTPASSSSSSLSLSLSRFLTSSLSFSLSEIDLNRTDSSQLTLAAVWSSYRIFLGSRAPPLRAPVWADRLEGCAVISHPMEIQSSQKSWSYR